MSQEIADKIITLRERKGIHKKVDLAEKAGLDPSYISRLEAGDFTYLQEDTLVGLARALEMTPPNLRQYLYGNSPDLPESQRTPHPVQIPIYTDFPFHAGSPTQPAEYRHFSQIKPSQKHIEGYIVHGNCLEPKIENGDIIIVDREGQIDNGDIVACLIDGELHLARLRKVADELWLENNNRKYRFQECQVAATVIEVIKRLK